MVFVSLVCEFNSRSRRGYKPCTRRRHSKRQCCKRTRPTVTPGASQPDVPSTRAKACPGCHAGADLLHQRVVCEVVGVVTPPDQHLDMPQPLVAAPERLDARPREVAARCCLADTEPGVGGQAQVGDGVEQRHLELALSVRPPRRPENAVGRRCELEDSFFEYISMRSSTRSACRCLPLCAAARSVSLRAPACRTGPSRLSPSGHEGCGETPPLLRLK